MRNSFTEHECMKCEGTYATSPNTWEDELYCRRCYLSLFPPPPVWVGVDEEKQEELTNEFYRSERGMGEGEQDSAD